MPLKSWPQLCRLWTGAAVAPSLLLLGHCPVFLVAFLTARLSLPCSLWQVLAELKEYATEVDVDFVRKAVRAIGRCAIKVEVRSLRGLAELEVIPPQETTLPSRAGACLGLGMSHCCSVGHVRGIGRAFHPLACSCWSCFRIPACSCT